VGHENGALTKLYPTADAYQRMAKVLAGVREVRRIEVPGKPAIFFFEVDRGQRGPGFVVWERRDELNGENSPAVPFECAWTSNNAAAVDVLGQTVPVQVRDGRLNLAISLTPIFIEP
jgi:hypothetical protein